MISSAAAGTSWIPDAHHEDARSQGAEVAKARPTATPTAREPLVRPASTTHAAAATKNQAAVTAIAKRHEYPLETISESISR